jgi:hypothetical protein
MIDDLSIDQLIDLKDDILSKLNSLDKQLEAFLFGW